MAEIASAFVSLMPSAKGFASSAERQIAPGMTSAAQRTGSKFGKVFAYSSMSPLKAIGAAAVGFFAVQKVKDFFGSAISEARESQKVSALTAQVIKSTGGAAGISAKQVGNLANSISLMTGIDDEAIQGAENLLLTFTNLRNEAGKGNDVFNQATKIVTDMSVALGQDMKSASVQVGKALNDPVKGISALSRVGVSFTDQQKKQIETLVSSGNTLKAQKIILGELNKEFGGAAGAAATSGDKFKTAFANLQESVGLALLPLLDKLLDKGTLIVNWLITKVPPAWDAFKAAVEPVVSVIREFVDKHLVAFKTALAALGGAGIASVVGLIGGSLVAALVALAGALASPVVIIGALAGAAVYAYTKFEGFRTLVQQVIAWFQTSFVPAMQQAVAGVVLFATELWARIQPLLPQVQQIFGQIVATVKSALTLATAEVKIAVAAIQFVWQHFGGTMLAFAQRTFQNILTAIKGALNVIQGVIKLVTSLIKGDWSGAWDAIKQIAKGVWQVIGAIVKQGIAQLQAVFGALKTALPIVAEKAWDLVKSAFVAGVKLAVDVASALPKKVVAALGDLASYLYTKGAALIQGLIDGMLSKLGAVGDAIGSIAGKIKGFLPGSPVKEGPLTSWNYGGAGKRLMGMLADGIAAASPTVLKAMQTTVSKMLEEADKLRDGLKSRLDSVKSAFDSVASSVASAFTGDLFSATNVHDFLVGLNSTRLNVAAISRAFHKLMRWGLKPEFLSELLQSGNAPLILDLASGTRGDAAAAGEQFNAVQSLTNQLGSQVARNQYGPQIKRLEDRLSEIRQDTRHLRTMSHDIAKELNNAVSHGQKKAS